MNQIIYRTIIHHEPVPASASLDSSAPLAEFDGTSPALEVQNEISNEANVPTVLSNGDSGGLHLPEATSSVSTHDPLVIETSIVNSIPAVDDPMETLIPPLVEPPTSDLREDPDPVSREKAEEIKEEKQRQDLSTDVELAEGMALGGGDPIERTMATETPATNSEDKMDTTDETKIQIQQSTSTSELPHHPPVPLVEGAPLEAAIDRAPSPPTSKPELLATDHIMQDVPPSPGKIARGREEDDQEEGPAVKRSRTELDDSAVPEFKIPDLPQASPPITNGNGTPAEPPKSEAPQPIAKNQHKFLLKGIQNIRRTKDAAPFNLPVDFVALGIPQYPTIITKPMDLKKMEEKLKSDQYPSIDAYVADFHQIVQNTHTFNGPDHAVTQSAIHIQAAFDRQMSNLPKPAIAESLPAEKKAKKAAAPKVTPARRESRSSGGAARSPTANAGSPQTFALGPQGVPLIRRDSTVGDGRPKREIHPPPPRDLPYSNSKPKKKKYQTELKFCQEVMNELNKPKYQPIGYPFYKPVDPVALNIPHYHKVIKKPMDLGTVSSKLKSGQYENAKEFESDVRLMFQNCYRFNPSTDPVHGMGKQFESVFDDKWAERRQWIDDHAPASGPQSPGSSPEPEDEDDEDEDDEDDEEDNQLTILQKQIAAMSKQVEMIQKKKSSPPAPSKKGSKSSKPARKDGKKGSGSTSAPAKKERKEKKATKAERAPWVTYEQKQDISNRINSLPESRMATALKIIRDNMPNLTVSSCSKLQASIDSRESNANVSLQGVQEDEIELDIDELSNDVLYKLLGFVRKYAPRADDSPPRQTAPAAPSSGPNRPKKNKPMSKHEQEARISEIRGRLSGFQNPGSDESPEPSK